MKFRKLVLSPASENSAGFTLIELMVVLSIISLMASVILVQINGARAKARDMVRKQTLRQLQTALEMYYEDHGYYPKTSAFWTFYSSESGTCTAAPGNCGIVDAPGTFIPDLAPKYINSLPHDPGAKMGGTCGGWKQAYLYLTDDGSNYVLLSHCGAETGFNHNDSFMDPARDGGSDPCKIDGSDPGGWAWKVSSSGGQCW